MTSPQLTALRSHAREVGLYLRLVPYADSAEWRLESILNRNAFFDPRMHLGEIEEQLVHFCAAEKLARDLWLMGIGLPKGDRA
jgi:hypothetical protein